MPWCMPSWTTTGSETEFRSWKDSQDMKAKEVSVSVVDFGGSLYVNITMKLAGHPLEMEDACPDTRNSDRGTSHGIPGKRVKENSRKRKSKDLQKFIEGIEFPEG